MLLIYSQAELRVVVILFALPKYFILKLWNYATYIDITVIMIFLI